MTTAETLFKLRNMVDEFIREHNFYWDKVRDEYRLKTKEGKIVYRAIKPLYRLAFGREYAEDTIEDLPGEKWLPIDEKGRYYISSLGRVKSYKGQKAKILKPYYN